MNLLYVNVLSLKKASKGYTVVIKSEDSLAQFAIA